MDSAGGSGTSEVSGQEWVTVPKLEDAGGTPRHARLAPGVAAAIPTPLLPRAQSRSPVVRARCNVASRTLRTSARQRAGGAVAHRRSMCRCGDGRVERHWRRQRGLRLGPPRAHPICHLAGSPLAKVTWQYTPPHAGSAPRTHAHTRRRDGAKMCARRRTARLRPHRGGGTVHAAHHTARVMSLRDPLATKKREYRTSSARRNDNDRRSVDTTSMGSSPLTCS